MAFHFRWHTAGDKPCYKCSRWDGAVFGSVESIPELPVHPNCECFVEAFDPNWERLEEVAEALRDIPTKANKESGFLRKFLQYDFLRRLFHDIRASSLAFEQVAETGRIFWKNYQDMIEANTVNADKYFHSKANAQAAQLGRIGEKTAELLSVAREVTDVFQFCLERNMTLIQLIWDIVNDLRANAYGRSIGRRHPTKDVEDLLDVYRPNGLDRKY